MPLSETQQAAINRFRETLESELRRDARFSGVFREDRPDGSTLATRCALNEHVWLEVALRPLLPQVRVGILTDDRWKSEDWEEKIQESGDSMSEFVGMGMHEAGLDWEEPPVEHYRSDLKYFYFATPLELSSLDPLGDCVVINKVRRMLDGYYQAFKPYLAG